MTRELRPGDVETYRRRRARFAAIALSTLGVIALTVRESAPHPGQTNLLALLAIGILVYVTPFAFIVDRGMRRGTTRMAAVIVVGVPGLVFLATRSPGSFGQVWPVFTVIVSVIALELIGQLIHAGVIPARHQRDSRRSRHIPPPQGGATGIRECR
jgi:hypothetical protein